MVHETSITAHIHGEAAAMSSVGEAGWMANPLIIARKCSLLSLGSPSYLHLHRFCSLVPIGSGHASLPLRRRQGPKTTDTSTNIFTLAKTTVRVAWFYPRKKYTTGRKGPLCVAPEQQQPPHCNGRQAVDDAFLPPFLPPPHAHFGWLARLGDSDRLAWNKPFRQVRGGWCKLGCRGRLSTAAAVQQQKRQQQHHPSVTLVWELRRGLGILIARFNHVYYWYENPTTCGGMDAAASSSNCLPTASIRGTPYKNTDCPQFSDNFRHPIYKIIALLATLKLSK